MRMLPGWTTLKASPDYTTIVAFAAAGTKAVWDASTISDDVAAGKYPQAAEETVTLLTGKAYLDALVGALQAAATKYGLPWLAVVDASALAQILKVVNLADLIVTTWSFFGDYFFNARDKRECGLDQDRRGQTRRADERDRGHSMLLRAAWPPDLRHPSRRLLGNADDHQVGGRVRHRRGLSGLLGARRRRALSLGGPMAARRTSSPGCDCCRRRSKLESRLHEQLP